MGARSDEYFYEAIETDGVFLRGGFFVGGEEGDSAVDFSITDPDGEVSTFYFFFCILREERNKEEERNMFSYA